VNNHEIEMRSRAAGVVPVLTIKNADDAVPLAEALIAGGLDVLEVTLRTEHALAAISKISSSGLDCVIGAGTILSEGDVDAARNAGATFLVTPGTPASLVPALLDYDGLVIPGAATATEALTLKEQGFDMLKFFPAEASGGAKFLKGVSGPMPELRFMPTGGVSQANMKDYLGLKNVVAVGGSWIAPSAEIEDKNWAAIEGRAHEAKRLAASYRMG